MSRAIVSVEVARYERFTSQAATHYLKNRPITMTASMSPRSDGDVLKAKQDENCKLGMEFTTFSMMATPAISGKMIVIRGQHHVFGIGKKIN